MQSRQVEGAHAPGGMPCDGMYTPNGVRSELVLTWQNRPTHKNKMHTGMPHIPVTRKRSFHATQTGPFPRRYSGGHR
ncbi:hypothetical protein D3C76_1471670 [compost metagenome]